MCNRWKDMHVFKKDHENCNHTGKKNKNMYFVAKTLFIKKKNKASMNEH